MPTTEDILIGLQAISNNYILIAVIWHAVIYVLIAALFLNWVPTNRLFVTLVCIPLLSVATFAWLTDNLFNGTLFSIASILILFFGLKVSVLPIRISQWPFILVGIIMILFGLVYPHFLETGSIFRYLYAAPVGLIPCPTLSLLIGFLLLYNGFGSKLISQIFIILGLFYGIFGSLKLAVHIDILLAVGSLTLLAQYFLTHNYKKEELDPTDT